jgi:hypothetical protein
MSTTSGVTPLRIREQSAIATGQNLAQSRKIIHTANRANTKAAITRLEGQTIQESDQRPHRITALQVSNIESFDNAGRFGQAQHLLQAQHTTLGVHNEDFRLDMFVQFTA